MIKTYCPICEDSKITKIILVNGQLIYRSKVCKKCESKLTHMFFKKVDDKNGK